MSKGSITDLGCNFQLILYKNLYNYLTEQNNNTKNFFKVNGGYHIYHWLSLTLYNYIQLLFKNTL